MTLSKQERALRKAKTIAVLMKIAPCNSDVDFKSPAVNELWETGATEDDLYHLSEEGAINFEAIGEEGFAPILICSTNQNSAEHLIRCIYQIETDVSATNAALAEIFQHNPNQLKKKISASKEHLENARIAIKQNDLLAPMGRHLDEIKRHFDSISKVADNYSSVYSNIVRPIEEEGKKGVRATVRWAILGIIASVVISNFESIRKLILAAG